MCWETNSRAIVMLTRCIEKGREKCDHYWPYDTEPVYYGDIQVINSHPQTTLFLLLILFCHPPPCPTLGHCSPHPPPSPCPPQVTILNESHFPDWNINEFRMMRGDTVRTIRHFHFTTWPDFGVPEPPQTLVRSGSSVFCPPEVWCIAAVCSVLHAEYCAQFY